MNISELKLFDAVVRWAGYQCAQSDLEINGTNMRQVLSAVIGEIRFLAMSPEEFTSSPSLSGILTKEECFAIFMNLINPGSFPVPLHLSSCRNQRSAFLSRRENGERSTINGGIYCLRNVDSESLIVKEPFLDKAISFVVNRPVIFKGIVFAGMILADQQVFNEQRIAFSCNLLGRSGAVVLASARVSHEDILCQVTPNNTLEPFFNCSVLLQPNETYRIGIHVARRAHFFSGVASSRIASFQGVQFTFQPNADLVRGIIFDLC